MKTIAWFVPDVRAEADDMRTVYRLAAAMEHCGYRSVVHVNAPGTSEDEQREKIVHACGVRIQDLRIGWNAVEPCDAAIATRWTSAAVVAALPDAVKKLYFIQDYAPWTYPAGSHFLAAERSYKLGLSPVTTSAYLALLLAAMFNTPAFSCGFGADTSIYQPDAATQPDGSPGICFLFEPGNASRCAELGIDALRIVKALRPETSLHLFGSTKDDTFRLEDSFLQLGRLDDAARNRLYNRCTLGLCLSASNPARAGFEMLAAGLPVVDMWRDNTLHDYPDSAVLLAEPSPEALSTALLYLLDKTDERTAMSAAGRDYMRKRSLNAEEQAFAAVLAAVLDGAPPPPLPQQPLYRKPPVINALRQFLPFEAPLAN